MTRSSWFDEELGNLHLTEYIQRLETWQRAMADGVISPSEVRTQADLVTVLLKELDGLVSVEQKSQLTTIFYEMAVLQAMQTTAMTELLRPTT